MWPTKMVKCICGSTEFYDMGTSMGEAKGCWKCHRLWSKENGIWTYNTNKLYSV